MSDPIKPTESQTPPVTPPATAPKEDPVKKGLLASVLGLSEAEPPKKEEAPAAEPPKKEEAPPAKKEEAPSPKKVGVRKEASAPKPASPQVDVEEIVKKTLAASQPAPKQEETKTTPPPEDLSALTEEQQEELALARLLEGKDQSRKGLGDKLKSFYQKERDFLIKRQEAEGDDYDPATDPQYRKFLSQNAPAFSKTDRNRAREFKIADEVERRTSEKMKADTEPKLQQLQREVLEAKERPRVAARTDQFRKEVAAVMPDEIVQFHVTNGRDLAKTRAEFPVEFDIAKEESDKAITRAAAYLDVNRGLSNFDEKNDVHRDVSKFIVEQANHLIQHVPAEQLVRDGKHFVHPAYMTPALAATHWTFGEEDVLQLFKIDAERNSKRRIAEEHDRAVRVFEASQRRKAAQKGADQKPTEPVSSPKSPSTTPSPGIATTPEKPNNPLASILGL